MSRCEEFKNRIDELVREFKDLTGEEIHEIFKELGLHRYCCRRMIISHVDLIEKLLKYNSKKIFFIIFNRFLLNIVYSINSSQNA